MITSRLVGRHWPPVVLALALVLPLAGLGCAVEVDDRHWKEPNGQWNEQHRPDQNGRCTNPSCPPGTEHRPPSDNGDGRRSDGGVRDTASPPLGADAAPPVMVPPPPVMMPPPATTPPPPPPPADPAGRCRIDAQCGDGRCQAGACQPRCTADASCGTGHTCREGFCQPSPQPGPSCLYSTSCPQDGVCINGFCHQRCATPPAEGSSCANPADRCDRGVCQPDDRPRPQCAGNAQCPAGWSCVDALCRTACRDDSQCGPGCSGTVCWRGFCVMPQELAPPPPMCPTPCAGTCGASCS